MSPTEPPHVWTRDEVQEHAEALGRGLAGIMPPGLGFALLMFDFGDGGTMAYASNGHRQDLIKALRECVANLERNA